MKLWTASPRQSRSSAQAAQTPLEQMAWIGSGAPGSVDKDTGVVEYANNLESYNVPFSAIQQLSGLPGIMWTTTPPRRPGGEYRAGAGRRSSMVDGDAGTGVGRRYH